MPDEFIAACECHPTEFPFLCARHGCRKNAHYHLLCRTQPAYFRMYEEGHGPGQFVAQPAGNPAQPADSQTPGFLQRAWNLAAAVATFVADGFQTVSAGQFAARLRICDECDQRQDVICRACGCNISLKARGRAMQCPLNKWPPEEAVSESKGDEAV